ncbi:MAG: hypothetical protein AAF960_25655 [Bacteroidota bacterium]
MNKLFKVTTIFTLFLFYCQNSLAQTFSTSTLPQNEREEGIMFDFKANQNLMLNGIQAILDDRNAAFEFDIFYKVGSHVGFENSSAGWTFLANTGTITSDAGGNLTTLPLGGATLNLTNGVTYAFYLENKINSSDFALNKDFTVGTVVTSNSIGTLFAGVGLDGNGTTFTGIDESDRTFIGTLSFTPLPAESIPTMSQWGSLIFGLLILNLSVFYVQRRELI